MIIITALAAYKLSQVILVLLPREPMPWVKVLAGVVVSVGLVALVGSSAFGVREGFGEFVAYSLAVATLAGATHTVLRLLTYLGDMALRRAVK